MAENKANENDELEIVNITSDDDVVITDDMTNNSVDESEIGSTDKPVGKLADDSADELKDASPDELADESPDEKQDKKKKIILLTLIGIGIVIIIVALTNIIKAKADYKESDVSYETANQEFVKTNDVTDSGDAAAEEIPWDELIDVDFDGLKQVNADVAAWIYFENQDISYPVMYSGDNETYLHLTYDKKEASAGALFMDEKNNPDFSDAHTLIYGHNMRNLSMFGRLKYYVSDDSYYEDHQYFQIITPDNKYRYKISSYKIISEEDEIYTMFVSSSDEFADFYKNHITSHANIKEKITVDENTKIITLSTCSTDDKRLVVSAYLVETK